MYRIEWTRKALKQLKKIDILFQQKIVIHVGELKYWPDCKNVIALKNSNKFRLRVGNYRIIFDIKDKLKIINIEEVKKRDERTY